jgi:cobalamin biosynthesis protein CobT
MLDSMDASKDMADAISADSDEPEDKGSVGTESDDSGKTGSEDSDAVDDSTDAGDSDGDKSGAKEGDDEGDKDSPDESVSADDPSEGKPDDGGDEPETAEDGRPEASPDGDELERDAAAEDGPSEKSDEGGDGESAEAEPDPLAGIFDEERDFSKDLGSAIGEDAKSEIRGSKYSIFSTEWDKIEPAPLSRMSGSVEKLEHSIRDHVGVMQKQLERGMAAKARKSWSPGQRRGRIAPGSLFKTSVGDDRVFRQRFETKAKNTAVSLVIDCSGSMRGPRIAIAGTAAFALSSVLERLRIEHEVIGFTSTASGEMTALMREDAKIHGTSIHGMGWGRVEPIYMPVFKSFSGKLDTGARSRMAHLLEGPSWLIQNIDGESIKLAARRLVKQTAERHIMIVLSDGDPCCSSGRGQRESLQRTVKELTGQGVDVIGIGIQTNSVRAFYPKSVVLNDLNDLPVQVVGELTKLLMAN